MRGLMRAFALWILGVVMVVYSMEAQDQPLVEPAAEEAPTPEFTPPPDEFAAPADETVPAPPGEAAPRGAGGQLEWRGVIVLGDEVQFSLHDPAQNNSFWVSAGEERFGVFVEAYDREENILTVRSGDATRNLTMAGGSVEAAPPALMETDTADTSPLVRTPSVLAEEARVSPETLPEELAAEARQVANLWQEAIQEEPRLQEIDNHFRELRLESQRLEQAMTQVPEDAPEYQALQNRMEQIQSEERLLAETALAEVRASPELRQQVGQPLGDSLRDQVFGNPLQTRPPFTEPMEEQQPVDAEILPAPAPGFDQDALGGEADGEDPSPIEGEEDEDLVQTP